MAGLELWRLLWRVHFRRGLLLAQLECTCTTGDCANAPPDPIFVGDGMPGGAWSACPAGQLRHPMLAIALGVDDLSAIAPLCAWPDTYSAGVVDCLRALHLERAIERERQRPKG